jgi:RNA polymerase sigma factor (sigma-70 family)
MSLDMLFQAACAQDAAARTDGQLLEEFLSRRNEAAFAVLLKRHGPMVLAVCRRVLGNEADAEDAFQAAFLVLIHKARSLTARAILGDWLHQVAQYTALQARVAAARRRVKERSAARSEKAPAASEPNGWLPRLDDALGRLPQKYRLPLILCDLEGKTRRQVADQLGWPEGTVAGRLARGRALLARKLQRGLQASAVVLPGLYAASAAEAAVRPALVDSLLRAAATVVAGGAASGVLSANALILSQGAMQAMVWNKVKTGILILLAVVALAGTGGWTYHALAGERQAPQPIVLGAAPALPTTPVPPQAELQTPVQTKNAIGEELFTLRGHSNSASGVAFSPDRKRLASASADHTVRIWDITKGTELHTLTGHDNQVTCVAFDPERNELASGGADGTVKTWNAATGKEIRTFRGHMQFGSGVHCLAYNRDGTRVASGNGAASGELTVKIWDPSTGKEERTLEGFKGMISGLAFSPNGKRLASTSGDRKLKLWDLSTGKEIKEIHQPDNYFASVAFSPDGKRLVTANDDKTVTIWDAETLKEVLPLKGHSREVTCAAFSPDGKLVASAGFDATLRLWDAATGKELDSRRGYAREIHSVAFNADGTQLATGSADGLVKVWQIKAK